MVSAATRACWVAELVEVIVSYVQDAETLFACLLINNAFRQSALRQMYAPEVADDIRRLTLESCLSRDSLRMARIFATLSRLPPTLRQLEEAQPLENQLIITDCPVAPLPQKEILESPSTLFMSLFRSMPHIQLVQKLLVRRPRFDMIPFLVLIEGDIFYYRIIPNTGDFSQQLRYRDEQNTRFLELMRSRHQIHEGAHPCGSFLRNKSSFLEDLLYTIKYASYTDFASWRVVAQDLGLDHLEIQLLCSVATMDASRLLRERQVTCELQILPFNAEACQKCREVLQWVNAQSTSRLAGVSLPLRKSSMAGDADHHCSNRR